MRRHAGHGANGSNFFRDAPCADSPKTVVFPEDGIETNDMLDWFLSLAAPGPNIDEYVGSFRTPTATSDDPEKSVSVMKESLDLIQFMQKYECETTLADLARKYFALLARDGTWGWQAFCLGAAMDCEELCMMGIRLPFAKGSAGTPRARHIPRAVWVRLDPKYTFALVQTDLEITGQEAKAVSTFCSALSKYWKTNANADP